MPIEPWQIPLLAMTLVILPPSVSWTVRWFRQKSDPRPSPAPPPDKRTRVLAVLTLALLVLMVLAIGPTTASIIAAAASAVSTMVSAALTLQSFLTLQEIKKQGPPPDAPS